MIKRVSEEFIDAFSSWSFISRQDHYDIKFNKKPTKRLEKEINLVFSAFGGCERSKFVYEFTYNPYELLTYTISYGYIPLAHMNYGFIPTQLLRTMNSYLTVVSNASVYYPFYGYGNFGSRHDDFYKFIDINACIGDFSVPIHDVHREEYRYDAIFMRPQFSGNLAWAAIRDNTKYLKTYGKLISIVDSKTVNTPIFKEHMAQNYLNVRCYVIPELTWTPTQFPNKIHSYIVYGEKI